MRWYRRDNPPRYEYICFACKSRYAGPTVQDLCTMARDHQTQCHQATGTAGVIRTNGEITPEVVSAIRAILS